MKSKICIGAVCVLAVVLMIAFVSCVKKSEKESVTSTEKIGAVMNTLPTVSNSSTAKATTKKTSNSTTSSTTATEEETTTDKGHNAEYQVTDGQEAINTIPSKNYSAADNLDSFFKNSVFVGDSITVGWSNYCKNKGAGFFGNPIFLARVGYSIHAAISPYYDHPAYAGERDYIYKSIEKMKVDKVFISFGLNDDMTNPSALVEKYTRLINLILRYSPDVKVYVISTTYITRGSEHDGLQNDYIRPYNKAVEAMCKANDFTFVDVSSYLSTTDGYLPQDYSSDGYVHLNATAYEIWETVLRNLAKRELDAAAGKETKDKDLEKLPTKVAEDPYVYVPQATTNSTTKSTVKGTTTTQKATVTGTEKSTESETKSTEKSTEKPTENVTEKPTSQEKPTEAASEVATEVASEVSTQTN